ncbi:hypothetical protein CC80DRAFT_574287, partial [Byssothecium circinans]
VQLITKHAFHKLDGKKPSDRFQSFLARHIQEAHIGVEAYMDIDVGLQVEWDLKGGVEWFCSWMLFPVVGQQTCLPILMLGNTPFQGPDNFDNKMHEKAMDLGKKGRFLRGWQNFGIKMLMNNGFGVYLRVGALGETNFTTPGLDLRIPRGEVAEVRWKDGEIMTKDRHAQINWRAPEVHFSNNSLYASVAMGPKVSLSFGLPGIEKHGEFSLMARFEMPRLQINAGQAHDVDTKCQKNGPIITALGIWMDLSIGIYANFVLPGIGAIIETTRLGDTIGKDWSGLMWTKRLWGICSEDFEDGFGVKGFEKWLNGKFSNLTSTLNQESADTHVQFMPKSGPESKGTCDIGIVITYIEKLRNLQAPILKMSP